MKMSLNFEKKLFRRFVLDISDSDATNKINSFSPEYSSTSVMYYVETLMEEFELVVAEEYKFEN